MSVNIKPLEDRIVVQTLEAEQTTASGLVIPDTAKEKPQEGEVVAIGPGRVDDADGVAGAAPIQSPEIRHGQSLVGCAMLPSVGRRCGTLINRRSGPISLALHPVARRVLPAPALRRVSFWPFAGKRRWPSWRALGAGRAFQPACGLKSSTTAKVH